jgi:hypothetical protein
MNATGLARVKISFFKALKRPLNYWMRHIELAGELTVCPRVVGSDKQATENVDVRWMQHDVSVSCIDT